MWGDDPRTKLSNLPVDILSQVFTNLPSIHAVNKISRVCTKFKSAAHQNSVWSHFLQKDFRIHSDSVGARKVYYETRKRFSERLRSSAKKQLYHQLRQQRNIVCA